MNGPLRSFSILVIALLGASLVLAACSPTGGGLGPVPTAVPTPAASGGLPSPDLTPEPSAQPSPSASPSAQPTPGVSPSPTPVPTATPAGTTIVRTYFFMAGGRGAEGLAATLQEVPETRAVATAAMTALLAGKIVERDGYAPLSTAIPPGSQLLGLNIDGGVATVDLSSEFESGGGTRSVLGRLAQVVYTLTQFSNVDGVLFRIEGRPVTVFSSEGIVLDGPVGRSDYEDFLPLLFVDRPVYGAALGNPARVTGLSNAFEATFRLAILDRNGRILADEMVMATCGSGCWGTFDATLRYSVGSAQWGTLRAYALSAKDGSPELTRDYPVWLTPAG